jgi:glycosyltransferase involved in cell wall biosynthesis
MRIIHISISNNFVPPEGYGGTERVINWLANAQLDMGLEVHVVCPQASSTRASIIPIQLWCSEEEAYQQSYKKILDLKPDIVHDHSFSQLFRLRHPEQTAVSTHHNERFQSVSNTIYPTRSDAESNSSSTFVYHGLDLNEYSFTDKKESYLLFLGAIHPRKNVDMAIKVANWVNMPLNIVGPVSHPGYFCKKIRKKLNDKITYHGEAMGEIKNHLLKNAKALLYLSSWESFGLSVIEAMVAGTPVITSNILPFHETVEQGVTGFICDSKKDFLQAINQLPSIKPFSCHERVVKLFSKEKMAAGYQKLYWQAINNQHW